MQKSEKAVLVTGASTGIGYACAKTLTRAGFIVFAGVRNDRDAERLRSEHENIRPITLDVAKSSDVTEAARVIHEQDVALQGIVNNAGIALAGPLEFIPLDEFRKQFDVNVFGALAVTQACLPLLRPANGRVIFMSSVSGQLAPPFVGPYASSKFALEALADSLRMELSPWNIAVSVIEPGNVKTPIWGKGRAAKDDLFARLPREAHEYYGRMIDVLVRVTEHEERTGIEPAAVAKTVLEALTEKRPRARYPVGNPPAWQRRMAAFLPEHLRDRLILKNFAR